MTSAADGFYANKLDPREAQCAAVPGGDPPADTADRAERAQDRLDAKGQRVIDQIDRQIASGVPATPDMWAKWADTVKGTSTAVEFQERVEQEKVVQGVLRLGPDQQQAFVQQEEAVTQCRRDRCTEGQPRPAQERRRGESAAARCAAFTTLRAKVARLSR
ncbi:hypothetical protein SNK04_014194 [Fusarium graminearum]